MHIESFVPNYFSYNICSSSGCTTLGVYGENCSTPCPQNCQGGHCQIKEGTCLLGCKPGYEGQQCDEGW